MNKLAEALARVAKDPEQMTSVESVGGIAMYAGPAQFRQYLLAFNAEPACMFPLPGSGDISHELDRMDGEILPSPSKTFQENFHDTEWVN